MKIPRIIKQRNTYVDRIRPFMRKTLVKVMVGHRRVGKSFILYQLMELIRKEESDANIIYINKEDVNFIDIKTYKELNDYILSKSVDDRMNYIFVDEIQEIQDFRLAIRSLALDDNNDIYVTGSNSEIFSSDLANELGGRYVEFVVYSLSYIEFLDFHELENTDAFIGEIYSLWRIALSDTFADGRTCCYGVFEEHLLYHYIKRCDSEKEYKEYGLFGTTSFVLGR